MPSAKRSSIRALALAAVAVAAALVTLAALLLGAWPLAVVALAIAVALAAYLIVSERRRHEVAEEELTEQASFLESLVESLRAIAEVETEPERVLEQARVEAERLFDAHANLVAADDGRAGASADRSLLVPLRVRDEEVAALQLTRPRPFERSEVARATLLADFAARAHENARLLAEANVREAERARLSDQLISAEQDERRRLALFLHDGPVQSMSGIALMLDAVEDAIANGRADEARSVMTNALQRHRDTIRSLRDLSFNLEPVVLRDQGFATAVRALAEQLGIEHEIQIDVDVDGGEGLQEKTQAALYQIIRDALNAAIRRGPPTRMAIAVRQTEDRAFETVISDDAPAERRRSTFDALAERARTLNGRLEVDQGDAGTTLVLRLPPYVVERV